MKRRYVVFMLALACFSFTILAPNAARAELSIAVVDIDRILTDSKAAKSIRDQVDKKRKGFLDVVKKEEDKLRGEQKKLEEKRNEIPKEELVKKIQEFEKQRIDARNSIQEKKASLDKSYNEAMGTLTKSIYEVCQAIANDEKIDLIITRQNIIVGSMSLDITQKVMEQLDKKLPNLTLK